MTPIFRAESDGRITSNPKISWPWHFYIKYTAISRKVVGKNVHAIIPKGNMGYVQYTAPDTVAVEPILVAFL